MHPDKLEWVVAHSLCPACRSAPLTLQGDALTCGECGRRYPVAGGTIDFLDAETRSLFQLEDTENVSDHPFDGNAMTIIDRCREAGGMVLDCGSGYKSDSYPHVVQMEIVDYPNVDVLSVNQRLPFADSSFDAVFSLDVLEHVNDPFLSAGEICRVLRPGGYLYVDLPFLQSEHGYPNHFFNATRSGLRRLFTELDVLSHHVPYSGRAIHTVYFMLTTFCAGLPPDEREQFSRLTVGEIVNRSFDEWIGHALDEHLGVESQWALASSTQALMRKPGAIESADGGGATASEVTVVPAQLPGFPEFRAAHPAPERSVAAPEVDAAAVAGAPQAAGSRAARPLPAAFGSLARRVRRRLHA